MASNPIKSSGDNDRSVSISGIKSEKFAQPVKDIEKLGQAASAAAKGLGDLGKTLGALDKGLEGGKGAAKLAADLGKVTKEAKEAKETLDGLTKGQRDTGAVSAKSGLFASLFGGQGLQSLWQRLGGATTVQGVGQRPSTGAPHTPPTAPPTSPPSPPKPPPTVPDKKPDKDKDVAMTKSDFTAAVSAITGFAGGMANFMSVEQTAKIAPEVGLANIAGYGNRAYDRIRSHDISDIANEVIQARKEGRSVWSSDIEGMGVGKHARDAVEAERKRLGITERSDDWGTSYYDASGKEVSGDVDLKQRMDSDRKFKRATEQAGGTKEAALGSDLRTAAGFAGSVANANFAGAVQTLGDKALYEGGFGAKQAEAQTIDKVKSAYKELNYKEIRAVQNVLDRAEMLVEPDLRTGMGYAGAISRGIAAPKGKGGWTGMSMGQAAQYATQISDMFGAGGGWKDEKGNVHYTGMAAELMSFGSEAQAKGQGRATTFAQAAGRSTASMLTDMTAEQRSKAGVKIIETAIAKGTKMGVIDGFTGPQVREGLATAIATASEKYGGLDSAGFTQMLMRGLTARTATPEEIKQRQGAFQALEAGVTQNPFLVAQSMAIANQTLGGKNFLETQALGGASLGELMFGGEGSVVSAFSGQERLDQAQGIIGSVLTGMRANLGDNYADLSDKELLAKAGKDKKLGVSAYQSLKNLKGFEGAGFQDIMRMLPQMSEIMDMGSLTDDQFSEEMRRMKQTGFGGIGKWGAGEKAGIDLKEITRVFQNPKFKSTLESTFKMMGEWYDKMAEQKPIASPDDAVQVFKAMEDLVRTIGEAGGGPKVAEALGKAGDQAKKAEPRTAATLARTKVTEADKNAALDAVPRGRKDPFAIKRE